MFIEISGNSPEYSVRLYVKDNDRFVSGLVLTPCDLVKWIDELNYDSSTEIRNTITHLCSVISYMNDGCTAQIV